MGIFSSVICYIAFSFLPIVLNLLLKSVSAFHAKIMAVLALISVPVSFMNLQNKISILSIIGKEEYLKVYTNEQLQSKVMLNLHQYENGILLVTVF